jgi:putative glycosyltransferase (TIGR04372 family)
MNVSSKLFKRFTLRLRMTLISRWQRLWIGISWTMIRGRILIPTAVEQWNISGSSFLPDGDFRKMRSFLDRWYESERIQRQGQYHRAVKIREEILIELYDYQGITNSDYFPPMLGSTWSSNFGHLSIVGHHKLAQKIGILPAGVRTILDDNKSANPELLREVSQGMSVVSQNSGTRWSDMPAFWHLSERIRTIKTIDGFMDGNRLFDEIFTENNLVSLNGNYLNLSEKYSTKAAKDLEAYGLPKSAKFVSLHIREGGEIGDPRTQPISSFISALNEITRNGYWVIRIGDQSMATLPSMPMVIDLVPKKNSARELHAFVLARCEFYLGTASGPSWVPRIFGVPSLITNLNEVATQVGRAPRGSIHLPKKYINVKGETLTLLQMFSQGLAFSSLMLHELKNKGLSLEPNSSEEILEATKEILESIMRNKKAPSLFIESINSVRRMYDSPTWGDFSESFILRNPKWLDLE